MRRDDRFDVVIIGANIAGCTAARLLGRAGARVALVERQPDGDAFKVTCTHQMLPSARPTVERLGLAPLLEARGAPRTTAALWTPMAAGFTFPMTTSTALA